MGSCRGTRLGTWERAWEQDWEHGNVCVNSVGNVMNVGTFIGNVFVQIPVFGT